MFGHRYFGESYFNGRYFGPESSSAPVVTVDGGRLHRGRRPRREPAAPPAAVTLAPGETVTSQHFDLAPTLPLAARQALAEIPSRGLAPVAQDDDEEAIVAAIMLIH